MSDETLNTIVILVGALAASAFVIGLHYMNSPATARTGNRISAAGMAVAVVVTFLSLLLREGGISTEGLIVIVAGFLIGGAVGLFMALRVAMTAMPQLVSLFNAVGGGAAAIVALFDYGHVVGTPEEEISTAIFVVLGVVIGSITFAGSLIASGKLQGLISGKPIRVPGGTLTTAILGIVALVGTLLLVFSAGGSPALALGNEVKILALLVVFGASLTFGVTMVLPIGGADMPVVISLLNSFTGTAAAMSGFVLGSPLLIIAGALVGAAGGILTKLMADAMNRSLLNIMIGGFGGAEGTQADPTATGGTVREVSADDAAIQLAYAQNVIIVPGYGLAVAQAQHACRELGDVLEERGVNVSYAIHPVAGRMPGHMNVLLAEANVPYPQLKEMDDINPEFPRCDVALVIGANDVTNPVARTDTSSPIYGMPILDVDEARSIVVIKRSMGRGYAGIDNSLYTNPKTGMLFADAKAGLENLLAAVKAL
ncbi:MAG TPA: NAD(P)(+) transhydrogenase (Re/Si-specific) subunit beta [Candidatus Deferrimicrobium sp.]|nr:NAD(P)(+) transhydrogenase (Re/Si-specific) subunit beta [Candidatus Deferrimicrobium sp.]